jgi:hypothetical protein
MEKLVNLYFDPGRRLDWLGHGLRGPAGWRREQMVERSQELRFLFGELDLSFRRDSSSEHNLMIVHVLPQALPARYDERPPAECDRERDASGPPMRDNRRRVLYGSAHVFVGEEVHRFCNLRLQGTPGLDETPRSFVGTVRQPSVDPANEAVEGMMIGSEGDEDERFRILVGGRHG